MVSFLGFVVHGPICEQGVEIADVQECGLGLVVLSRLAGWVIVHPLPHHACVEGEEGIGFRMFFKINIIIISKKFGIGAITGNVIVADTVGRSDIGNWGSLEGDVGLRDLANCELSGITSRQIHAVVIIEDEIEQTG